MMPENFEKLVIGSAYEGAEGMFDANEQTKKNDLINTRELRQERGIFTDAQERYEKTLADRELEQVKDLGNGITYPSLDEWVDHRIANKRGSKFFPSFVKNKEGEIFFCKAQISENPATLQGLELEAQRLKNIPQGVNTPQLVNYVRAEDNRSALILTEAINAMVGHPNNWFVEDVPDVIRQIKLMEDTEVEPGPDTPNFAEKAKDLLRRAGATLMPDLQIKIDELITAYEPHIKPRFVHGDACTKNILLGVREGEGTAIFVDWEFKGSGFLGQDAAKLWSELRVNEKVSQTFLESYLRTPDGGTDQTRKSAIAFGVAVENLAHLVWRNEEIIGKDRLAEFPNTEEEIKEFNLRIRDAIEKLAKI